MVNNTHEDNQRIIVCGAQILAANDWLQGQALIIEDSVIKAMVPMNEIPHDRPSKVFNFPSHFFVVPGFIDVHMHGLCGADVMDASFEALQTISTELGKEGVTSFLATTMSAEPPVLTKVLQSIAAFQPKAEGAELLGVHLEGPFISQQKQGAQRKIDLPPNVELFAGWQTAAQGAIKLMTLAPELPESEGLMIYLKERGVRIAVGHSNASFEEAQQAISQGACHATHLFNAMSIIHHRAPGVSMALLLNDEVTAELIVDGHHLHPAMANLAYRLKPKHKLILVTDSMRGKCLPIGNYDLGGQAVTILDSGKAVLEDGTLAGSVLSLPEAIRNMVQHTGCTLAEAIAMVSYNPANLLGLTTKGRLEVGKDADIAVLNQDLAVMQTMSKGKVIYSA